MSLRAARPRVEEPAPRGLADHDAARVLAVLERSSGPLTIAQLRSEGIKSPAHAIYVLQLAGYPIDSTHAGRRGQAMGYRLHPLRSVRAEGD